MIARHLDTSKSNGRLEEAAATGVGVEVILVLRGRVRRAVGPGRWRIRLENGRVLTFPVDLVVASTLLPRAPRRVRR